MEENITRDEKSEEVEKPEGKQIDSNKHNGIPIWVWIIIIILIIVCIYFLSLINNKKFQICERDGYLIVKKGLFLPYGFSEYVPADIKKREAYLPLKIPEGEKVGKIELDMGELDIALFKIISVWIEKYLANENEESLKIASGYIERLMKLNVSPDDFERFSRLKGELLFKQAKFNYKMGLDIIKQSREKIISIKNLNPEFKSEAEDILGKIERMDKAINPDYILLEKKDIDKIREDIKKECISSCVKESMEKASEKANEPASTDSPSKEPAKTDEK